VMFVLSFCWHESSEEVGKEKTVKRTCVVAPGRIGGFCHDIYPVLTLVCC